MNPVGEQALAAIDAPRAATVPLGERLAATPRLACEALCRAINTADREAALRCFAIGAGLVGPDGSISQGEAALRARLGALISAGAQVSVELRGVLVAGDLAFAHERWRISYAGKADRAAANAPGPTLVLRMIAGEWKLAIAAPWGLPASKPLHAIWP